MRAACMEADGDGGVTAAVAAWAGRHARTAAHAGARCKLTRCMRQGPAHAGPCMGGCAPCGHAAGPRASPSPRIQTTPRDRCAASARRCPWRAASAAPPRTRRAACGAAPAATPSPSMAGCACRCQVRRARGRATPLPPRARARGHLPRWPLPAEPRAWSGAAAAALGAAALPPPPFPGAPALLGAPLQPSDMSQCIGPGRWSQMCKLYPSLFACTGDAAALTDKARGWGRR